MKIGILTQPLHNNYGGLLQNYALQTVLKNMGHEVWTVDRSIAIPAYLKWASVAKRFILHLSNKHVKVRVWMNKKERDAISVNTRQFINQYIRTTEKVLTTSQLEKIDKAYKFDAYVVGSDQVWRPAYSPNIYDFFLGFVKHENLKRIAYSASFGVDEWEFSEKQTQVCAELAKKFDAISVRENMGIKLCSNYLDMNAIQVLDPTLLLNTSDYLELVKIKKTHKSKGKMFVYILDKDKEKENLVSLLSDITKLESFETMPEINATKHFSKIKNIDLNKCVYPPVEQWVRSFLDAEFIVTDSFHGTVFSILFEKPFIVIGNKERGLSRFNSLLELFGLEDRLVFENDYKNISSLIEKKINYSSVVHILNSKRKEGLNFLQRNLSVNS
ncbi:MAG TPA: polysaccharide pyruvyl transferase family protein [Petrimonas sp.]|nr:polysaccharide pyruvyl transferase family protein [Petrimonas sp.]